MNSPKSNPIGYLWIKEKYGAVTLPYWRETRVLVKGSRRLVTRDGCEVEYLPAAQSPGEGVLDHLEFALRKEGLHLELLRKVLPNVSEEDVTALVCRKPTGRYVRMIWWLFEEFKGVSLDIPDVKVGNYVDLLDADVYVTGPSVRAKRQRVNVNLLGTIDFSPMVRRKGLGDWDEAGLRARCQNIIGEYPPEIFERAVRYLYAKESKRSYEIERETPTQNRAEQFVELLEQAWHRSFLKKEALVELQKVIVDERYANDGWRSEIQEQIYVGETLQVGLERVHFVGPKPEDLDGLMDDFLLMARRITARRTQVGSEVRVEQSAVPTLIAAAVISFGFDFLHPFSDGNGRIHRFLLHHVLARNEFGPKGIILPVSAVILNRPREYDLALESFSKPLMKLVNYRLDDRQRMTVTNETVDFYRYIDCTELCRITIGFITETIESELPAELRYLTKYDDIREKMRDVVVLPDRVAGLFVKLCRQNGGVLSGQKRGFSEFKPLTDDEIERLEMIVSSGLDLGG